MNTDEPQQPATSSPAVAPDQVRHGLTSDGDTPDTGITRYLSELARELQAEPDMDALLNHIVAATVNEIDGAAYGGISLVRGRTVQAIAATDPLVERLDELQNELDSGPCLSSLREAVTVRSDDLRAEPRWPEFVAAADAAGIRSMLSVQLFVDAENLGALNLYATEPDTFTTADESTAVALAAHAAVAMKGARIEDNLRSALGSRDVIGQGKGILMERYKIGPDEAFNLLVLSSQRANRKLRDVADELTRTGELRMP